MPHDAARLEELVRAALNGDSSSLDRFFLALWPLVRTSIRGAPSGGHCDETQEIFTRLIERLTQDDLRGLRSYDGWKERHPEKTFLDWIHIVLANLSRDRLRERLGRQCPEADALPSAKRLLNELAQLEPLDDIAYRPPVTSTQTAREIMQYAAEHLPPLQANALAAWLEGQSFEEFRRRTGLKTHQSARRVIRAALATLRRQFAADAHDA